MNVVISQPMYFPWVGMLEQVRLADHFVFYDDVQFSKGSFVNRVQIKTAAGIKWLTVPIRASLGQRIQDVQIDSRKDWRRSHLDMLRQAYTGSPYLKDMLRLVQEAFDTNPKSVGELSKLSMIILNDYFGLKQRESFQAIQDIGLQGAGSYRVLKIVQHLGGDTYITGHGAIKYLDHEAFDSGRNFRASTWLTIWRASAGFNPTHTCRIFSGNWAGVIMGRPLTSLP